MSQNFLEQLNSKNALYLQHIRTNTNIKELRLPGNKALSDEATQVLFKLLKTQNLTNIHLNQIQFTKQSFQTLLDNISHMSNLQEIEIFQSNIDDQLLKQLCDMLINSKDIKLKTLKLSDNQIEAKGAKYLAETIKQLSLNGDNTLESLQLGGNKMKDGIIPLCIALTDLKHFKSLGLRECQFTSQSYQVIANLLSSQQSDLEDIQFKKNNLSKADIIFKSLSQAPKIRVIECESCQLNKNSFELISQSLQHNTTLHAINFELNDLTDSSHQIAFLVLNCSSLTTLCLNSCQIDSKWLQDFFSEILKNEVKQIAISGISLKNNKIENFGLKNLKTAISLGKITSLDLSNNRLTNGCLSILASGCKSNQNKLRHLDLSGNDISGPDSVSLGEIIQFSQNLLRIFITDCGLQIDEMDRVADAIEKSQSLINCTCGGQSKYKNIISQQAKERINKQIEINKQRYQEEIKIKQIEMVNSQASQKTTSETSAENVIPLHHTKLYSPKSENYLYQRNINVIIQDDQQSTDNLNPYQYGEYKQPQQLYRTQSLAQMSADFETMSSVNSLRPFLGSSDNINFYQDNNQQENSQQSRHYGPQDAIDNI